MFYIYQDCTGFSLLSLTAMLNFIDWINLSSFIHYSCIFYGIFPYLTITNDSELSIPVHICDHTWMGDPNVEMELLGSMFYASSALLDSSK